MTSHTKENYLKTIFHLHRKEKKISLSDISKALSVSIPTVNSMVKRLQESNWVVYERYKPLKITEKGLKEAALIIRKHRIAEMFLVEKMGFGWEEVHAIAEEIEHINSNDFFDKMDEMLGFPTIDPHGSPIPDKEGRINRADHQRLSDLSVGKSMKVHALSNDSDDFLLFLNNRKIHLGSRITILEIEKFDSSMTVTYDNHDKVVLSKEVASRLLGQPD